MVVVSENPPTDTASNCKVLQPHLICNDAFRPKTGWQSKLETVTLDLLAMQLIVA